MIFPPIARVRQVVSQPEVADVPLAIATAIRSSEIRTRVPAGGSVIEHFTVVQAGDFAFQLPTSPVHAQVFAGGQAGGQAFGILAGGVLFDRLASSASLSAMLTPWRANSPG